MSKNPIGNLALAILVASIAAAPTFSGVRPALAQTAVAQKYWPHPPWPWPQPHPRPALQQQLQLVSERADIEIHGALAKTHLTQTFTNPTDRTIEGTYLFPLPDGAAISDFAMMVNGKRVSAEVLDGDKAREIYTGIVRQMRDPGILEFIDRNVVRARIFPVAPGAEQTVELEYSEALKPEGGSYRYMLPLRLPTAGAAQSAMVNATIDSPDGVRAVYSPTHQISVVREGDTSRVSGRFGDIVKAVSTDTQNTAATYDGADRDFVLYYTANKARVGVNLVSFKNAGEDGYFMLLAAPDPALSPKEIPAKDVVFVCDTSGSMEGAKIEQARNALRTLVGSLNASDRFNIITFSSDTHDFRDAPISATAANVEAAREWIERIKAVGGTEINDALADALGQFKDATEIGANKANVRPRQIVFMTDGQPTVGETDNDEILKNVRTLNAAPAAGMATGTDSVPVKARLFVFGVGYDVNTRLLDSLAEENKGASDYVLPEEDIEQKVGALYSKIAYPVLSDVKLDWHGANVYDVYPKRLPDLFRGGQAVVFGRFNRVPPLAAEGAGRPFVELTGWSDGHEQHVAAAGDLYGDKGNDLLPRLWAMRKVGFLLDDARINGLAVSEEVKNEIIALSKEFGIVTPFTAALITNDDGEPIRINPIDPIGPVGPLGPMPMEDARGQFGADALNGNFAPAPMSGKSAVMSARATGRMRKTTQIPADASPSVRYIAGKSFILRGDTWIDSTFKGNAGDIASIKFASPEYFDLLKDDKLAKWLSVGDRVIVVLAGRTIKIEP